MDPGGEVPRLMSVLGAHDLEVDKIVLTHAHIDHAGGVKRLRERVAKAQGTVPPLCSCGREETFLRSTLSQQASFFGLSPSEYEDVPEPEEVVRDGSTVSLDSVSARVLFTPGHSPGHLAFFFEEIDFHVQWLDHSGSIAEEEQRRAPVLIGGDALFSGSIGRTDLPGGDHQTLLKSIREKLYVLPGHTRVLSGHGPDTTIERERTTNPFVRG